MMMVSQELRRTLAAKIPGIISGEPEIQVHTAAAGSMPANNGTHHGIENVVLLNEIQSRHSSTCRALRSRTLGCEMMQAANLSDTTGFH